MSTLPAARRLREDLEREAFDRERGVAIVAAQLTQDLEARGGDLATSELGRLIARRDELRGWRRRSFGAPLARRRPLPPYDDADADNCACTAPTAWFGLKFAGGQGMLLQVEVGEMLSVIVEVTQRCNSNCRYCLRVKGRADLSEQTLRQLYRRVGEYLSTSDETVEIEWHGGEPLLRGVAFYEEALRLSRGLDPEARARLRYAFQTNLTRMTPAFLPVLTAMSIKTVGTSFDPAPGVRGYGDSVNSDRYKRAFVAGVASLQAAGLTFAVNHVVTRRSLDAPAALFVLLTNLCSHVSFNPVRAGPDDELRIEPSEYADFLSAAFSQWWPRRARFPGVAPLVGLHDRLTHGADDTTRRSPFRQLWVSPDGMLHQCGRAEDHGDVSYGTLEDSSFAQALALVREAHQRARERSVLPAECARCPFLDECHSGGVPDAFSQNQRVFVKGAWCDARWAFIARHYRRDGSGRYHVLDV